MLNNHFLRFSLVGVVGFIVDAGLLHLLIDTLGPYIARLLSFAVAVITTWILNRTFTFAERQSGLSLPQELGRYFSAMIVGGSVNYALYAALVYFIEAVAQQPILGVIAGTLAGLTINFTLSKRWIFSEDKER